MPRVDAGAAADVWVLLGAKHGDNRQLLAIAEALPFSWRAVPLRFNAVAGLPPLLLGARRISWRGETASMPPWPRLVLAAGRRSVPAARWIRERSGGGAQLVHVNRPWAPLAWFDLVVTTPPYGLPERPNVLTNLLPFQPPQAAAPPLPTAFAARAATLPRPWTAVLIGGDSRPYVLDAGAAVGLAGVVTAQLRAFGGSAWLLASPRTPAAALAALDAALGPALDASRRVVVPWGGAENPYRALLGLADRFVVTADSASMLAEALTTGRPVTRFLPPARPDRRWRLVARWRAAALRAPAAWHGRAFAAALDLGLLSSVRDLERLHRSLDEADAALGGTTWRERAERERDLTIACIRRLLEG